ncbi:MAG: hypothetical protein HYW78_02450 [Parcubacteria group bacterium]|nr:hypothetical protein [Parcubacteria group bacterium]
MDQQTATINLIKELHLDTLPEEKQQAVILKIGDILYRAIMIRALDMMSESDKDAFDAFLTSAGEGKDRAPEEIMNFLATKIPNFDAVVKEEVGKFKEQSLQFVNEVMNEVV